MRLTRRRVSLIAALGVAILITAAIAVPAILADRDDDERGKWFISESELLTGLAAGALYPFIDTTPNRIARAHIAITDATTTCGGAGATAPANIVILVGVAGGTLVSVMTAATNTGIGTSTQCVFHVTIRPGNAGVPSVVTDIVVVNGGSSALTGVNTVTVSALVK